MDVVAYNFHERPTQQSKRDTAYSEKGLGDPEGIFPSRWFHGKDQMDEFLSSGLDLLVIATPLTAFTQGLIGAREFNIMSKKRPYVCNVGRGPIIRTDDLIVALETGLIRGAALDVTDPEPLPEDHRLWKCENVIITPHVSGNSNHYNKRLLNILEVNLRRMNEGEHLVNAISRTLRY